MATKKRPTSSRSNPQLAVAAFCSKVLEGIDGAMSGIRFGDTFPVLVAADRDPEQRIPVVALALISFRRGESGDLSGEHVLRLVLRTPTGKKVKPFDYPMKFESNVSGFNHRVRLNLKIKTQGQYWADVFLDGKKYTSMPFRVEFVTP
jgi:Family of unknown function (DUF6941)